MGKTKQEFVAFLLESQALKFGNFILKSGRSSPFFIDISQINTGKQLATLGSFLAQTLVENFPNATLLYGPPYKGISLATLTAEALWNQYQHEVGVFYSRKEVKDHGEGGIFFGNAPTPNDQVIIIDDVISDGSTKLESFSLVEKSFGVKSSGVLVAVDRSLQACSIEFPVCSIIRLRDICEYLAEIGNGENEEILRNYIESFFGK